MDILSLLLIALGLSADCFAVALGASGSARKPTWLQMLRMPLVFGISQAVMPVLGWLAGRTLVDLISEYDHWVAFGLLAAVGGRMLWGSLRSTKDGEARDRDYSKGLTLAVLAVATSIDALAVGLSFAFLTANIAIAALIIGAVAFMVTLAGFLVGRKAGQVLGERAEAVGGLVLIAIGLRVLVSHLME